jgi:hypothetical protein
MRRRFGCVEIHRLPHFDIASVNMALRLVGAPSQRRFIDLQTSDVDL